MKTPTHFGRIIIGLTLAAFSVPLIALDQAEEDGTVVNAPRYQERVGFTDLDLRQSADKKILVTRVRQASRRVCSDMAHDRVIEPIDRSACTYVTYRETRPQIRRAFARADAGEKLAFTLTIGAPKKKV